MEMAHLDVSKYTFLNMFCYLIPKLL
uniref:Uncharacterized protein n=1 Tax=Arundo donax TaxID=35708 RepID=A0A0A8Y7Y0_ARUDO